MKTFRYLLLSVGLLACKCCLPGCGVEGIHNANPQTIVRAGSFSFENGKDVTATLEHGVFDPSTRAVELKNLQIVDNASAVRKANVEQIDALARESYAVGQAWSMGLTAGAQLAAQLMPGIASWAPRPPWGSGQAGVSPPNWLYYGSQAGAAATQPATSCPTCGMDAERLRAELAAELERLRAEIRRANQQPGTTE